MAEVQSRRLARYSSTSVNAEAAREKGVQNSEKFMCPILIEAINFPPGLHST